MSINKPVQLGLCCMNVSLKKKEVPVYASRRIILRIIDEKGIEELKRRITLNLKDLLKMIDWNEENGIKVFRLSSELFQHKTNPKAPDYDYDFALDLLKEIGKKARSYNQRLTFHPGQFNVLGTPRKKTLEQTIKDLTYHAEVFDLMGMGKDSVMVIHGGGVYGEKEKSILRWCINYFDLSDKIKNRLVLENCEKSYSIEDCLRIHKETGVPVVFDTHHFECYKKLHPDEHFKPPEEYIPLILDTWKKKDIKPKFHVSEQGSGKIGHHSDYIDILPEYLLEIPEKYGVHIDIMIEAKMKELSIQKLYEKYPQCNCKIIQKDEPLTKTNENQGHGKSWEIEIQKKIYNIENPDYKNTEKYDIPLEDNKLHHKNVSIKTSGCMSIDMGDILRFLNSENMDIICIIYKQKDNIKEAYKTIVFDFYDFLTILKKDLEKCNLIFDEWILKIEEYDKYVKSLPKEYYPESKKLPAKEKEHLIKKIPLCNGIKYFNIAPKIDRKQQRVQCNINIRKVPGLAIKEYEGGVIYDKKYTKTMVSSTRKRNKI